MAQSMYPGRVLSKLSNMMFDLMRIAEEIEAHERSRTCTCGASGKDQSRISEPLPDNVILLSQVIARCDQTK
jgi:hypothetical protein